MVSQKGIVDESTEQSQCDRALLAARAEVARQEGVDVPSPCISVCRISAQDGFCEGCLRTLGEVSGWARSSQTAKRLLWQTILQRIDAKQPWPGRPIQPTEISPHADTTTRNTSWP